MLRYNTIRVTSKGHRLNYSVKTFNMYYCTVTRTSHCFCCDPMFCRSVVSLFVMKCMVCFSTSRVRCTSLSRISNSLKSWSLYNVRVPLLSSWWCCHIWSSSTVWVYSIQFIFRRTGMFKNTLAIFGGCWLLWFGSLGSSLLSIKQICKILHIGAVQ